MLASLVLAFQFNTLERILSDPKLDGAVIGAIVTELDGTPVYEHNSAIHVVPASNQKLLSNSFALWALGASYRPETRFWKLKDRVVIDSPGDPLMTYEQLKTARRSLNIQTRTPVYVRESYAPEIPDSWEIDDLPNRFAAGVTALTFDRGGFEAWSKKGRVALVPESFGVQIKSTSAPNPLQLQYDVFARKIQVSGTLPKADLRLDTLALPRPDEAAASIFGNPMFQTSDVPNEAPDYQIQGASILEMVGKCLPPSDNNIAENLLLMGAQKERALGSRPYEVARKRLSNFLIRVVGISPQDVHPFDGSGLSRHNFVTARAIAKLLSWSNSQATGSAWRSAMAHSGTGTLSRRLRGIPFDGKTGSLDMVSALSGYVTTKSGKTRIVSLIFNAFTCTDAEAHGIQDAFVTAAATD